MATNDLVGSKIIGVASTINVALNDTPCGAAVTTYALQAGSQVNVSGITLVGSTFSYIPTSLGAFSFIYDMLCNGVVTSSATVSGIGVSSCTGSVISKIFTKVTYWTNTGNCDGLYIKTSAPVTNIYVKLDGGSVITLTSADYDPVNDWYVLQGQTMNLINANNYEGYFEMWADGETSHIFAKYYSTIDPKTNGAVHICGSGCLFYMDDGNYHNSGTCTYISAVNGVPTNIPSEVIIPAVANVHGTQWFFDLGPRVPGAYIFDQQHHTTSVCSVATQDFVFSSGFTLKSQNCNLFTCTVPTITTQPISQSICTGQQTNLEVIAAGTAPLSYQWSVNGVLGSVSSDNFLNTSIPGTYYVIVSNACGTVTSSSVTVTELVYPSVVSGAPLPDATAGVSYNHVITLGGNSSYTIQAETHPSWLTATLTLGNVLTLTGTPTFADLTSPTGVNVYFELENACDTVIFDEALVVKTNVQAVDDTVVTTSNTPVVITLSSNDIICN